MSTKAKLTRCEVSKARLIYPFSKADVTDSSGFILIGYQKDKNYALTGRHLCLSSPIRRPLAEREIEDQERYKEEVSTPLQEDWLLSTSSFSSSDSSYTITFALLQFTKISSLKFQGVDQEMLPESKKKFWTNAVNGGGSGCSGDSFLKEEARRKQVVLRQFALQGLLRGSLPVAVSDAADRAESRTLGDDGTKTALSSPRRQEG
ncbi:hypothetical protein V6N11_055098 [Hibiscus sabdariffa]|uniref:Uncharacterized protein n=1 Tax=Hibiscus sabdariffa TaxID=183260 RepID=A0ABR1ZQQ4_9ROSI